MPIIFEKDYDGESLYDLPRDISEAFNDDFNKEIIQVPKDEFEFLQGTFKVKIEWIPEE